MSTNKTSGVVAGEEATLEHQTPAGAPVPLDGDADSSPAKAPAGLTTDHRATVTAHAARGDYVRAADAHTAHLRENWDRAWQMWLEGHGPHRDKFQKDYAAAQDDLTNWLVGIDKNLRGEVEALVSRWQREAAA